MHALARPLPLALLAAALWVPFNTQAQITGKFGDCDPVIHDKLVGAEWRSPSACEVSFDAYARKGITAALQPVIDSFTAQGWQIVRKVETQSLTSIPRHTETKPFQLTEQQMHQGGAFYIALALPQNSPTYQKYNQATMDLMAKAIAQAQSGKNPNMDAANAAARALEENTSITISVSINQASTGIVNFKAGHTLKPLPGGGYTLEVPYTQSPSGGDITASQRVTFAFLGAWAAAPTTKPSGTGEDLQVNGALNSSPANLMKVQNIRIRIQGGTAQAQRVLSLINWNLLGQLIAGI